MLSEDGGVGGGVGSEGEGVRGERGGLQVIDGEGGGRLCRGRGGREEGKVDFPCVDELHEEVESIGVNEEREMKEGGSRGKKREEGEGREGGVGEGKRGGGGEGGGGGRGEEGEETVEEGRTTCEDHAMGVEALV